MKNRDNISILSLYKGFNIKRNIFTNVTVLLIIFCFCLMSGVLAESNSEKKSIKGNLKICFVIDTSDSMNKMERFVRVKKGLNAFVDSLIEGDYFIAVTFDTRGYLNYSGIVGDENIRSAIKRVFDDAYPDNEPVKGGASQVILGLEKGFEEIEKTPPYQSTVLVMMTDGDHNPIPPPEEWKGICDRIKKWQSQTPEGGYRKVFVVDVGDPKHSLIMANDMGVTGEDYFPFTDSSQFAPILEKIRSKIPYYFGVMVFPSQLNLGRFYDPKEILSNYIFILNNPDFIKKGGFIEPRYQFYRDGKEIENPGISLNIPHKMDTAYFGEPVKVQLPKNILPGKYEIRIKFIPGGDINTILTLEDERGNPTEDVHIIFEVKSWMEEHKATVISGLVFLLLLLAGFFILKSHVESLPSVKGELKYHEHKGEPVDPQSRKIHIPTRIFMFNSGKNMVTIGSKGDIRFPGIPYMEQVHFQIEAESPRKYQVKPVDGLIEILDSRETLRGNRGELKHNYFIKVINKEKNDEYIIFKFDNPYLR